MGAYLESSRARLRGLGTVNLLALEEYEKKRERWQFLTQQREDLLQDTSYEPKEVDYLLVLGPGGELVEVLAPRNPPPLDAKGRPLGRLASEAARIRQHRWPATAVQTNAHALQLLAFARQHAAPQLEVP